jgi:nucleotide-binding universal stress UspA family protein
MQHILLPIDNSSVSMGDAIAHAIRLYRQQPVCIHLLNIQPMVSRHVAMCFPKGELRALRTEFGQQELATAEELLRLAGIPFETAVKVGRKAETIALAAQQYGCELILMGDERPNKDFKFLSSLAQQVRHLLTGMPSCRVV